MGGGKGFGGSKTATSSMPQWHEDIIKQQAAQAQTVGMLPYMPWMMPDVAAAPPQLQSAWNMGNQWSNALGMGGAPMGNMRMPQQGVYQTAPGALPVPGANPMFGGGHASWPMVNQNLAMMESVYPGIMDAYYNASPEAARPVQYDPNTGLPIPGTASGGPAGSEEGGSGPKADKDFADYMEMRMQGWGGSGGMDPVAGNFNPNLAQRWRELNEKFGG